MAKKKIRTYYSLVRQRQADETRTRIAEAARKLILGQGYGAATMEAIAREAGGHADCLRRVRFEILAELIDRAAFGPAYQDLVGEAMALADPVARLRMAPRIARQIYDAERSEIQLLREAGVIISELAAIEQEKECGRYEAQGPTIALLVQSARLAPGLSEKEARDIFWTLTARDVYRMLAIERKWNSDRYEKWLGDALVSGLVTKKPSRKKR